MPIYTAKCQNGHAFPYKSSIDERNTVPACPQCQAPAERTLTAPFVKVDFPAAGRR